MHAVSVFVWYVCQGVLGEHSKNIGVSQFVNLTALFEI